MTIIRELLFVGVFAQSLFSVAIADDDRMWPSQALPAAVVRTSELDLSSAQYMLAQSISGLTAKAVNKSKADEMVWVSTRTVDFESWYGSWLKKNPTVEVRGEFSLWQLVDRYSAKGVIKGYILYAPDNSSRQMSEHRKDANQSVNVATSLAGLLDGILIDESLEAEARQHGLKLLMDARDKTQQWCFDTYRDQFSRKLLCNQDPKKPHVRDLAIAQQALVLYGADEPTESAMKWLEPLSPIIGWNGGDEFETTRISTIYGHFQTATDWCMNLPILMSGAGHNPELVSRNYFDPKRINFNDRRNSVSFVLSDGDNIQWYESSFFHSAGASYWDSADRGKIPFGWSCCFALLAEVCPVTIDHALATKKENDRMIEWGGGYYYPDLFGSSRSNGHELLAQQSRRTWTLMKKTGTRIIGFNVAKATSPAAVKAYETIVGETDDLLAVLAFQYDPYEGGAGTTIWVKDRRGIEIPVVTARYSVWEHSNKREHAGTPAKVAHDMGKTASISDGRDDWAVVHAWSYFRHVLGDDEDAENMPQSDASSKGGIRGYSNAVWCAQKLPATINVVSPEELAWRIRMKHDTATTKKLIDESGVR